MNAIVVTKVGDIINVVYNGDSDRFDEYSRNMATGQHLAKLANDNGVETNILCNAEMQYRHNQFNTIAGVAVSSNQILFDELEKLL